MVQVFIEIIQHTWLLFSEAAPWLVFGLVVAGLIKAFVPEQRMAGWLGGRGIWPVSKAALIGAPLPLCSCSVIPVAISLHRSGASRASTTAFLVSAPETGVDSIAASYALLGPLLTVVRPIAAVGSALITGLVCDLAPSPRNVSALSSTSGSDDCDQVSSSASACCGKSSADRECVSRPAPVACCCTPATTEQPQTGDDGLSGERAVDDCCAPSNTATSASLVGRLQNGLRYAISQIFVEFAPWLAIGLLIAGATITLVPPSALAAYGSGLPAMLLLLAVGVPLYVCATESTPIATALLAAGVSPGAVLVFLMAGPATNVATVGALRNEFGTGFVAVYLASVSGCAIAFGLLTNALVYWLALDVVSQFHDTGPLVPLAVSLPCAVLLLLLTIKPLRLHLMRLLGE